MHRRLAVLLMVALAAACGGRTGHTAQPAARTPIAPSTGATQPASNIPVSSSPAHTKGSHARTMTGGTHTSSPAATSGSKSGPSPAASGGSNATPAKPRQPGTYTYDTSGQTTYGGGFSSQMPSQTSLKADPPRGVIQRSVRDLRDSQGNGSVTETWLEFRTDGVYLDRVRTTTTFGPTSDVRDFRPKKPALVAKPGAGVGWHTAFTMTGSNTTAHVTIDVIREERLTIDGQPVDTFLVRTHTTFSGDLQGDSTADTWFTPDRLLPVKEHDVTDAKTSAGSFHSEYRAELKSLSPQ